MRTTRSLRFSYAFLSINSHYPTLFPTKRHLVNQLNNGTQNNIWQYHWMPNKSSSSAAYSTNIDISTNVFKKDESPKELVYTEDPDNFGLLSKTNKIFSDEHELDEGDKREEEYLKERPLHSSKLSIKKYSDLIKEHVENKQIKEALDVLEIRMLKEDKVKPDNYIYNILIGACADVGYTKKAFTLFNDMKKRALQPTGATYTSLFNACANSPWPEDGLQRARKLIELMAEKSIEPNITNYNAMIKAFGRCGDLVTAFQLVDEMQAKKIKIRVHTFNFLLQSCISDKDAGFRHALITWRKMLKCGEKPNVFSFNLLLRCIKDCGVGNTKLFDVIEEAKPSLRLAFNPTKDNLLVDNNCSSEMNKENNLSVIELDNNTVNGSCDALTTEQLPNLISVVPHMGSVIAVNTIKTSKDRFMLVGGLNGFLEQVEHFSKPDIKTFTQLLSVIPDTLAAEEKLLLKMKALKVSRDISFYNLLIRKRCYRQDYESAKAVRALIDDDNSKLKFWKKSSCTIKPDILTFGVLALACNTEEEARELLKEMKEKRLRVNSEIAGALIKNGAIHLDFKYVLHIMDIIKTDCIPVNEALFLHLKKLNAVAHTKLKEVRLSDGQSPILKDYELYYKTYKDWLNHVKFSDLGNFEHPWTQFRVNQPKSFQRPATQPKPQKYPKNKKRKFVKYEVKI